MRTSDRRRVQRESARPELSYVLAARSGAELRRVAQWLWQSTIGPEIEVVLAGPAQAIAGLAARLVPPRAVLASSRGDDLLSVRRAGAAMSTGLVVIVIDCDADFEARLRGPLAGTGSTASAGSPELERWAAELDRYPAVADVQTGRVAPGSSVQ